MRPAQLPAAVFAFVTVLCVAQPVPAYETQGYSLRFPTSLSGPKLEADFQHRFFGSVIDTPVSTSLLGFGTGVNAVVGLRGIIWSTLETAVRWDFIAREVLIEAGYSYSFLNNLANASLHAQVYNYGFDMRITSWFADAALGAGPFVGRISPAVDIAFDGERHAVGVGLGLNVNALEWLDVVAEYIPLTTDRDNGDRTNVGVYSAGVVIKTIHHQFSLMFSNSDGIGLRRNMLGASDWKPRFGFEIKRLWSFD